MFTAVSRRSVEITPLRALGFHAGPVVMSALVEATVFALAGGILGAAAYGPCPEPGHAVGLQVGGRQAGVERR